VNDVAELLHNLFTAFAWGGFIGLGGWFIHHETSKEREKVRAQRERREAWEAKHFRQDDDGMV